MAVPRIVAEGVTVTKGGRTIVRDVTMSVRGGEVLGVLGPSGAGKSTFFDALVGEVDLTSGRVLLGDRDVSGQPLWRRARSGLGYVPQSPSILYDLSVRENLRAFIQIARHKTPDDSEIERDALRVGLAAQLDVRAGSLSGGERRRLELGRALTAEPSVLVCDEPFAGVDPEGASHLGSLLAGLAGRGVAVLLADHHVEEALRICTRALLLLDGSVAVVAEPDVFREDPRVRGRYLGTFHAP
jgi:lipopolysaccharide export system ATP-binding protein